MLLQLWEHLQGTLDATSILYGAAILISLPCIAAALITRTGNISTTHRQLKNLHKLGLSASNMDDQYNSRYDAPEGIATNGRICIKSLYIHPVKSCAPIELDRAQLTKTGFMYDRCCAFAVNDKTKNGADAEWHFISQRTKPTQMADFKIDRQTFGIHYRQASGLNMGNVPSVAAALPSLKKFLGLKEQHGLTLMKCTEDTVTRTDKNLAPLEYIGSPAVHGYTDQQPIHLNSLSSVHEVSTLLPPENQPLNALRFRANIWVTGAPAFEEETWKRYYILPKHRSTQPRAHVAPRLTVVCRTSRCTMPNVDPFKGKFDADNSRADKKKGRPQPSATLVEHRTVENGNKAALGYIGMHCVPEDLSFKEAETQGRGVYVKVGDEIEVLERGVHLYGSTVVLDSPVRARSA
ncbi:hypothetical protein DL95DRAFT_481968 [Leptodontidium sp. 2 PMI_412]|nr:hypothetical protein DL95DRAFT_481968 [Leptodontidium sp. 2 PMI_412]